MVPFEKDFYREHQVVAERDPQSIKNWMREKEVTVTENGKNKVRIFKKLIVR